MNKIFLAILFFLIPSFSFATVPVNNALTGVLSSACQPSDSNTNCGGGSGSGNVGIGTTTRIPVYIGTTTIGSPYNNVMDSNGNIGIGTALPAGPLEVKGASPSIFNNTSSFVAGSGGTLTTYSSAGVNYNVHTFTSSSTFTAPSPATNVQVLVIGAGAGGGGAPANSVGAGGGAPGEYYYNASYSTTSAGSYTVTVGTAGTGGVGATPPTSGGNSVFNDKTAIGGGYGGYYDGSFHNGANGGSGGGAEGLGSPGTSTASIGTGNNGGAQFNDGTKYIGGGGGGASGVGVDGTTNGGGAGGPGTSNSITGTAVTYSCGGGGGVLNVNSSSPAGGAGGCSGAGAGGGGAANGSNATGYGSGGGGAGDNIGSAFNGGNGFGGIVIVAYIVPVASPSIYAKTPIEIGTTAVTSQLTIQGTTSASTTSSIGVTNSNGTQTFFVQDNGNVGIGSGSPGRLLDVFGSVRVLGSGNIGVGSAAPGQSIDVSGNIRAIGTNQIIAGSDNSVAFASSAATSGDAQILANSLVKVTVKNGGNVGVGTALPSGLFEVGNQKFDVLSGGNVGVGSINPGRLLDVFGTVRVLGNGNVGIGSTNPGQALDVNGSVRILGNTPTLTVGGTSFVDVYADVYNGSNDLRMSTNNGQIGNVFNNPLNLMANNTTYMTIAAAGNVGVGSTNPGMLLDVAGSVRLTGFTLVSGAGSGKVLTSDGGGGGTWQTAASGGSGTVSSGTINQLAYYAASGTTVSSLSVATTDGTNIGIGTSGPSSLLDVNRKLNVLSGGNVGIGSLTPGKKLDVNGSVRATAFFGDGSALSSIPTAISNSDSTITVSSPTGAVVVSIPSSVALGGSPTTTTQASSDNSTKIATTAYVTTGISNAIAGVNPAVAVQAATTAAGDTSGLTYNNGVSGIGATFTGSNNTALTVDGYTFTALGQRLLVKDDTQSPSGAFNGVYYVTQVQTAILPPILTRALDYDMPSDINNTGAIPVINGTLNATTTWVITSQVTTVGTDPLTYAEFSLKPSTLVTSTGFTANQIAYASATGQALVGSSSLTFNGTNVGIGSATPGRLLDVQGTTRFTGVTNGVATILVPSGNIGIGSATPGQVLDVVGTIRASLNINDTALTASRPVITDASKNLASGTYSGNTTTLATTTGTLTNTHCVNIDASGNLVDSGATCGGSASAAGGTNAIQYNSGSATFAGIENIFSFNGTNVGIGTTNGKQTLDVEGTVTILNNVGIGTTSVQTAFAVTNGNVGIGTWTTTHLLDIGSGATAANVNNGIFTGLGAVFSGSANVISLSSASPGITGSSASSGTLTISGNGNAAGSLALKSTSATGTTDNIKFLVGTNGGTTAMEILDNSGVANVGIGSASPGQTLDVFGTMRVIGNGNVGIGSASPGMLLDVAGSVRLTGFDLVAGAASGYVLTSDGGGGGTWQAAVGGGSGTVNSGTAGQAAYYASSTTAVSGTSNLVFNGSNVGIGSATPGQKLDVQGTARFTGSSATTSALLVPTGNVGIGSASPGQVLDVSGTIRVQNGNIGIAIAAPVFPLHVVGNVGIGTTTVASTPYDININNVATFNSEFTNSNIGVGTTNINWNNGNYQNVGIGTNGTNSYVTFTHPTNGSYATLHLRILEDATGARAVSTWPATVKWAGGTAPTLSAATKSDFIDCRWNGTSDFCSATSNF